jgi:hypothetical protein
MLEVGMSANGKLPAPDSSSTYSVHTIMTTAQYDFRAFLERMAPLSYASILREAELECGSVERTLYVVKGAPKRRDNGGSAYVEKIRAFLFFMRYGTRPGSASDADFRAYKLVVQALVERGEFKPDALSDG